MPNRSKRRQASGRHATAEETRNQATTTIMLNIISHDPEGYHFTTEDCTPLPHFQVIGCGCCSFYKKVTEETILEAKQEAKEWLAYLETLQPADYSKLDQ